MLNITLVNIRKEKATRYENLKKTIRNLDGRKNSLCQSKDRTWPHHTLIGGLSLTKNGIG